MATALFAENGFHGVSTRDIAGAAGVNLASVHYHFGNKRELFVQVLQRLYRQEREWLANALGEVSEEEVADPSRLRKLVLKLVDTYLDLVSKEPAHARLYVQLWLDETEGLSEVEAELSLAVNRQMYDLLQQAREKGTIRPALDNSFFLRSLSWLIYSYFVTGPADWSTWRGNPHDPANLQAFKTFLYDYLTRMLWD